MLPLSLPKPQLASLPRLAALPRSLSALHSRSHSTDSAITYTLGGSFVYLLTRSRARSFHFQYRAGLALSQARSLATGTLSRCCCWHVLSLATQRQRCLAWLSAPLFLGPLFLLLCCWNSNSDSKHRHTHTQKRQLKGKRKAKVKLFGMTLGHCTPLCGETTISHSFGNTVVGKAIKAVLLFFINLKFVDCLYL